tara:strand:+ start:10423 stop:11145 length:723 start_codon:yes stop_codon:yes gene_type:complete
MLLLNKLNVNTIYRNKKFNLYFINHFQSNSLKSFERIGPHDKIIYDIIIASLLGEAYAEKRGNSTRIHFNQKSINMEYLHYLYKEMQKRGYSSNKKPKSRKQIGKKNKVYFSYKFKTFSFSTFNWIYTSFYKAQNKKCIPHDIENFLSPRLLAIWIMANGNIISNDIIISINSFNELEIEILQKSLLKKFNLDTYIHYKKNNKGSQIFLYFYKNQIEKLFKIIKPFMISSMYSKIQPHNF